MYEKVATTKSIEQILLVVSLLRLDLVANYIRLEGKTGGIYQHTVTFE